MHKVFSPKRGASLLTMILLVAVIGVMVVAAAAAIVESSRAAAISATTEEAEQSALTGVQEGLSYLNTNQGALTDGEYGRIIDRTAQTNYSLTALRRGFTRDSNNACALQTTAQQINNILIRSNIDLTCPYYDMAIRNRAAYSSVGVGPGYALLSRDMPNNVPTLIPVRSAGAFFVVGTDNITSLRYAMCTQSNSCGSDSSPIPPGGAFQVTDLNYRYMRITVTYVGAPTGKETVLSLTSTAGQTVVGKGYTTLDVVGHSGDSIFHYLYTVRAGQPFLSEITGTFDQNGVFQ